MNKYEKNKGQVAVEYVLLLIVVISLALVFVEFIDVGNSPDGSGASVVVEYWRALIRGIGADVPHP